MVDANRSRSRAEPTVTLTDPKLGRMTLNRDHDCFEGKVKFSGKRCKLIIEQSRASDDRERDERDIERARTVIARMEKRSAEILAAIAREYLPLYNDTWRNNRPLLDRARFVRRLKPATVVVERDGTGLLFYADGGLFYDHAIGVCVGKRGAISRVFLAG